MAKQKTALGQEITDKRGDGVTGDDLKRGQARQLWEGSPSATFKTVAEAVGSSPYTVRKWANLEKWVKKPSGEMAAEAQIAADNYKQELSKLGPEVTTEERDQAVIAAGAATAVEMRAAVLDRHRKEWQAPRQLSYEAVKGRDFEKAKLAKITAETLMLIQSGERKAWGMDTKDKEKDPNDEGNTIVIERDAE